MKQIVVLITVIFLASLSFAQRPPQNPISQKQFTPDILGYKLFWEDQFNGDNLDPKKWDVRGEGPQSCWRCV